MGKLSFSAKKCEQTNPIRFLIQWLCLKIGYPKIPCFIIIFACDMAIFGLYPIYLFPNIQIPSETHPSALASQLLWLSFAAAALRRAVALHPAASAWLPPPPRPSCIGSTGVDGNSYRENGRKWQF